MAAFKKLKLLALHCAAAESSSSPSPSPPRCFSFRRRRLTIRRLLSRRSYSRKHLTVDRSSDMSLEGLLTGHKLKDLFVSSPPPREDENNNKSTETGFGSLLGRVEEYPVRNRLFGSVGLRFRLLRGVWRPRLAAIPE